MTVRPPFKADPNAHRGKGRSEVAKKVLLKWCTSSRSRWEPGGPIPAQSTLHQGRPGCKSTTPCISGNASVKCKLDCLPFQPKMADAGGNGVDDKSPVHPYCGGVYKSYADRQFHARSARPEQYHATLNEANVGK